MATLMSALESVASAEVADWRCGGMASHGQCLSIAGSEAGKEAERIRKACDEAGSRSARNDVSMNISHPPQRDERTVEELREERDELLSAGDLRLAAEVTTWIDELMAELGSSSIASLDR
jgi:hypothetical protein